MRKERNSQKKSKGYQRFQDVLFTVATISVAATITGMAVIAYANGVGDINRAGSVAKFFVGFDLMALFVAISSVVAGRGARRIWSLVFSVVVLGVLVVTYIAERMSGLQF